MKAYFQFEELALPGARTRTWLVRSVQTGALMGVVKWRPVFGRYEATFADRVSFEEKRLGEVVVFLRRAMAEHCKDRKKAKKARF